MISYLIWLNARLLEMKRLLKTTGTVYIHLDWHASHYVKVEADKIFGYDNFQNEIIWCYETGGRSKNSFPKKHDVILRYGKTKQVNFFYDQVALPRDFSTMHETIQYDKTGRAYQRNIKHGKEYFYYVDKGVLPNDWWTDIQALNPAEKERIGYPTQKPEKLLERIIKTSSQEGDVIADFFCGGGTTPTTAQKLNRRWIACDQSRVAVAITQGRLESLYEKGK
jgi:adenine specific DNA methylase Mod